LGEIKLMGESVEQTHPRVPSRDGATGGKSSEREKEKEDNKSQGPINLVSSKRT